MKTAVLSVVHHGVQNGDDVGEQGKDCGQPGNEDAVRLIACGIRIKMKIRFSGRWKAEGGRREVEGGCKTRESRRSESVICVY